MSSKKGKSKGGNNAYFHFLMDLRKKMSMSEANVKAAEMWPKLSEADKEYYKELAGSKRRAIMTTLNEDVTKVREEEENKLKFKDYMQKDIIKTIKYLATSRQLSVTNFYFIHFNVFCITNDHIVYPAEVGLSRFNFEDGALDHNIYHSLIHHKQFPMGYASIIKTHCENSHKIPALAAVGNPMSEVISDIFEFIEEDSKNGVLPALYVIDSERERTEAILTQMADNFGYDSSRLRVYSLTLLFFIVRNNLINEVWPTISQSIAELAKDHYEYTPEIACEYHQTIDVPNHCSRSRVVRWIYKFCDNCCTDMKITMIPGRHIAENCDVESAMAHSQQVKMEIRKREEENSSNGSTDLKVKDTVKDEWKEVKPQLRRPHTSYLKLGGNSSASRPRGFDF